uniref:Uncharacterized protein n=1 Tax=Melopsittacus undulatus TaxID=13146 RepID=A0A8V5GJR0_MELUD
MQSKGRGGSYSHTAPFFRKRFSCRADKNSGTLFISGLELEDSALYYCALQGPQWEIPGGRLNNISFLLFSCSLLHVHRDHSPSPWQISRLCLGSETGGWVSLSWSLGATEYAAAVEGRATMSWDNLQSKSSLSLHALQPQDSARYFCAVHTETGNPPENFHSQISKTSSSNHAQTMSIFTDIQTSSVPQVILMKSKKLKEDDSTRKAACLARNVYTKNISLDMSSNEVVYEPSASILTPEGLYDTIKVVSVTSGTEVSCTASINSSTITTSTSTEVEKANMLSMAVLGLRVLLAKSIAFNTLMSIKLFLF